MNALASIPPENRAAFNLTLERLAQAREAMGDPRLGQILRIVLVGAAVVAAVFVLPPLFRALRPSRQDREDRIPEED